MEFFSADGLAEEESKAHESIPWYPDHGASNVETKLTKELEIRLFAVLPNLRTLPSYLSWASLPSTTKREYRYLHYKVLQD